MAHWKLFIDDNRWPNDGSWFLVRNVDDAIQAVRRYGFPNQLAIDYDLQQGTVEPFVEWLKVVIDAGALQIPPDFTYNIISTNPDGAVWLREQLNELLEHYQTQYVFSINQTLFYDYLLESKLTTGDFKADLDQYLALYHPDTPATRKFKADIEKMTSEQLLHYIQPFMKRT